MEKSEQRPYKSMEEHHEGKKVTQQLNYQKDDGTHSDTQYIGVDTKCQ